MTSLSTILDNIVGQRSEEIYKKRDLTMDMKDIIYHEIVKAMVEGYNEYSLHKFGFESINSLSNGLSIQKQIYDWIIEEHRLKCVRKYVDIEDWTNDLYYYVILW